MKQTVVVVGLDSLVGHHLIPALLTASLTNDEPVTFEFVSLSLEPKIVCGCSRSDGKDVPEWVPNISISAIVRDAEINDAPVVGVIDVDDWGSRFPTYLYSKLRGRTSRETAAEFGNSRAAFLLQLCQATHARLISLVHCSVLGFPHHGEEAFFLPSMFVAGTQVSKKSTFFTTSTPYLLPELMLGFESEILAATNVGFLGMTIVTPSLLGPTPDVQKTHLAAVYPLFLRFSWLRRRIQVLDVRDLTKIISKALLSPFVSGRFLLSGHMTTCDKVYKALGFVVPDDVVHVPENKEELSVDNKKVDDEKGEHKKGDDKTTLAQERAILHEEMRKHGITMEQLRDMQELYDVLLPDVGGVGGSTTVKRVEKVPVVCDEVPLHGVLMSHWLGLTSGSPLEGMLWETLGVPYNDERAVTELGFRKRGLSQTLDF